MTPNVNKASRKEIISKIKKDIRDVLSKGDVKRAELIRQTVERSPLTAEQKKDRSPAGELSVYRSLIGSAIAKMEKYGDIVISEDQTVTLKKETEAIIKEAELGPFLLDNLRERALTEKELASKAVVYFGASDTPDIDDDRAIERLTKYLLSDFVKRNKVRCIGGRYSIGGESILVKKPTSVYDEFISVLNSLGGEYFESFTGMLLEKYYAQTGRKVRSCSVIGGSDDGGIDVMLEISDGLGFQDTVLVQCKQKTAAFATLKEVKEFVGAFYVDKGSRGIFITTSRFHKDAAAVLAKLPDIVPIDGKKLFELASMCSVGLKNEGGNLSVDRAFFGL